jgi:hypothetical protein
LPTKKGTCGNTIVAEITESAQAKRALWIRHGCLPAPRWHNDRILGIDHISELFQAHMDSQLLEELSLHFRQTGNTFEHVILGVSGFATIDPANIATLLTGKGWNETFYLLKYICGH